MSLEKIRSVFFNENTDQFCFDKNIKSENTNQF